MEAAKMQTLKNKAAFAKRSITILRTSLDNGEPEGVVERNLDYAENALLAFETLIETEFTTDAEEAFEYLFEDLSELQGNFGELQTKFKSLYIQSASQKHIEVPSAELIQVKLPHLNIPQFSGNYEDYLSFIKTFDAIIHNNESLTAIQKQQYLISCLKPPALNVIKSLEISEENYLETQKLLKNMLNEITGEL